MSICLCVCAIIWDLEPRGLEISGQRAYCKSKNYFINIFFTFEMLLGFCVNRLVPKDKNFCLNKPAYCAKTCITVRILVYLLKFWVPKVELIQVESYPSPDRFSGTVPLQRSRPASVRQGDRLHSGPVQASTLSHHCPLPAHLLGGQDGAIGGGGKGVCRNEDSCHWRRERGCGSKKNWACQQLQNDNRYVLVVDLVISRPGEARGCSTNNFVIHSLIHSLNHNFPPTALQRHNA